MSNNTPVFGERTIQFLQALGKAIEKMATAYHWDRYTMQNATKYVMSLTAGDATLPRGLKNDTIVVEIKKRFALCCLIHSIPNDTFPGQRTTWFDRYLRQAEVYWKKHLAEEEQTFS